MTRPARKLSPSQTIRHAGKVVEMSQTRADAARQFSRDYQAAVGEDRAAVARIRAAVARLTDHENLVVTLLAGNGANLQDAARRAHRGITQVRNTYREACEKLAAHYRIAAPAKEPA